MAPAPAARQRATIAAGLAVLLAGAAPAAAADWIRVETRNFVVYGDAGEGRVREIADEFERFREALGRVIPNAGNPAAVPTIVVAFESSRTFAPYRPRYNGRPIELGGYCLFTSDQNILAVTLDGQGGSALRKVLHEFVHLIVAASGRSLPLWVSEGLAEYYSTFQLAIGGRTAVVGAPIQDHLRLLNERRPMTIPELLAVEESSPDYNEGDRRSLFYAQSWAIVHMLVAGSSERAAALSRYTSLVQNGTPSLEAWTSVFGTENVVQALIGYVGRDVMRGTVYRFDRDIPTVAGNVSKVTPADASAAVADLLRLVAPPEEASAALEKAIALKPSSPRAKALYGLHLIEDQPLKARTLLLDAAGTSSDWLVQYHVASGLIKIIDESHYPDPELVAVARRALAQVVEARPNLPHALALGARLESAAKGDSTKALDAIRRARRLAPGREDYALDEAHVLVLRGEYVAARRELELLLSPRFPASVRANAQSLMDQLERAEQRIEDYLGRLQGLTPPTTPGASPRAPTDTARGDMHRTLQPGEERLEGRLERIACTTEGLELHVVSAVQGGATERFPVTTLDGIDFISYRSDLSGAITCGPRNPPDPVYLTWRLAGGRRVVVAVEFLRVK